ncbi:MAG: zinc-regulated TonB-dependent outer membrane receptor [Kofleriaceae bacterium]|nr:zinc-regulated TonB-dependent outer membrane receptor [Kofleriaceae bacterium]MCL4226923.1 zinc-regulated TonB-dependent outer membrane receptor [Myxococcales bacterium]
MVIATPALAQPTPGPDPGAAPGPGPGPGPGPDPDPAAPDPDPAAAPDPDPDPASDADLADLEAALTADAAARADAAPAPARSALASAAALMNPDLSFILDVTAAWFGSDEVLPGGGHDPAKNGFNLQQLELAFGKAVDPYFRVDGNLVFSQFGVELEEAFATTLALPHALQARIGQFLTRFGRVNPTHLHAWDFVDQPFAIGRVFGGEGNRGLGVELSWLTPLPWFAELIVSATDPVGEATARSFFGATALPLETPLDVQTTIALEQFFELSPDWSLLVGLSLATGPNATGHGNRSDVWGADLFLKWRPITRASDQQVALTAEVLHRRRQVPRGLLVDTSGYAQAVWRFARRWDTALRWEYGSSADAGGADYLDPAWTAARHRTSAALTFRPTEFSRLRAQGSYDRPGWRDGYWAAFLAMEFAIGAHGAHTF